MISEFPLFVFTVLTGIAAGAYVGAVLFPKKAADEKPWLFPLIAAILVGVGALSAVAHLGRPAMVFNVLNNPTSSLTLEGATSGLLALIAIVDFALALSKKTTNRALRIAGAVAGIICMCIVTSAYATSYGNPVWTAAPTYALFAVGDLAAGFAFWMLFADAGNKNLALATGILNVLFAGVLAWQAGTFANMDAAGVMPIAAGAVLAVLGACTAISGKPAPKTYVLLTAVLVIAALAVSRYGFYMASII